MKKLCIREPNSPNFGSCFNSNFEGSGQLASARAFVFRFLHFVHYDWYTRIELVSQLTVSKARPAYHTSDKSAMGQTYP